MASVVDRRLRSIAPRRTGPDGGVICNLAVMTGQHIGRGAYFLVQAPPWGL